MAHITYIKDPARYQNRIVETTEGEVSVIEWLANIDGTPQSDQQIYINGDLIVDSAEGIVPNSKLMVGLFDHVTIINRPNGVDPFTALVIASATIVGSALLIPKPKIPNDVGGEQTSPNNQLSPSRNEFRPYQAAADIMGAIRAYPDFIQPSYYEYVNNRRQFRELLLLGVGYHDVQRLFSERTPLDEIQGAGFTVYQPNEAIPAQLIVNGTNDVDGYEPVPSNDPTVEAGLNGATINYPNGITYPDDGIFVFDPAQIDLKVGDVIEVSMSWHATSGEQVENRLFEVESITPTSIFVSPNPNWSLSSTDNNVTGFIRNTTSGFGGQWFSTVGEQTTSLWIQCIAPQGLKSEKDEAFQVSFRISYQEIDASGTPIGAESETTRSISGNTRSRLARTFKIDGLTPGRYRVRVTRLTPKVGDGGIDRIQIEDIQSVREYTPSLQNVTRIFVERIGTDQPLSSRDSRINVDAQRLIPIFNPDTGTFGTKAATRSFAQAVMYHLTLAGVPLPLINYQQLFEIEDSLSDPQLGYFDFSFDDKDIGLESKIVTICNAARVRVYYEAGNVWSFTREEAKSSTDRVAYFNRRNLLPMKSVMSRRNYIEGDHDSIALRWTDPDTDVAETIYKRWNFSTNMIEEGRGLRIQEMELAGCRNETQARNRAELEIRKLIYQRIKVQDVAKDDFQFCSIGDLVLWADIMSVHSFDGEIVGINGNDYDTSERFTPEEGVEYWVFITDANGVPSESVRAYPRTDTIFGFNAPSLAGAYVASGAMQLGSRYFIASNKNIPRADYVFVGRGEIDAERNTAQIKLDRYEPQVFGFDLTSS